MWRASTLLVESAGRAAVANPPGEGFRLLGWEYVAAEIRTRGVEFCTWVAECCAEVPEIRVPDGEFCAEVPEIRVRAREICAVVIEFRARACRVSCRSEWIPRRARTGAAFPLAPASSARRYASPPNRARHPRYRAGQGPCGSRGPERRTRGPGRRTRRPGRGSRRPGRRTRQPGRGRTATHSLTLGRGAITVGDHGKFRRPPPDRRRQGEPGANLPPEARTFHRSCTRYDCNPLSDGRAFPIRYHDPAEPAAWCRQPAAPGSGPLWSFRAPR